jgi:uncharacterized damage-inducible protein DinB
MALKKEYRKGAVGALMDEYERAGRELELRVRSIPNEIFEALMDPETADENCRSIQTIVSHVVNSGYGYADYLREQFGIPAARPPKRLLTQPDSLDQIGAMLIYMNETLDGRWQMSEEQITATIIQSRWGVRYDMEQLLEHAIVHLLRHRRQIDKFLQTHTK